MSLKHSASAGCPSCGSSSLLYTPNLAYCRKCLTTYQLKKTTLVKPQSIEVPAGRVAAAVLSGVASSLLTAFITGSWPLKTDPQDVRMKKLSNIVSGAVASGFIGLLSTLVTS